MKRLVSAVAAVATLAGPTLALAQDHEHERGGGRGGQHSASQQAAPQQAAPQQAAPQYRAPQQAQTQPQAQQQPRWQGYRQQGGGYQGQAQAQVQPQAQAYQPQARQWQGGGRQSYQGQGYQAQVQPQQQPTYQGRNQNGYQGQNAYQGRYQNGYQGQQAYRGGYSGQRGPRAGASPFSYGGRSFYRYRSDPYRYPSGYGSWSNHNWRRGEYLPSFFFLPNYYISDYWSYGLWEPEYGLQWIRVGSDALLIDLATGEVVDSVPGVYY